MKIISQVIIVVVSITFAFLLIGCCSSNESTITQQVIKTPVPSISDSSISTFKDSIITFLKTKSNGKDTLYLAQITIEDTSKNRELFNQINKLKASLKLKVNPDTVYSITESKLPMPVVVKATTAKDAIKFILLGIVIMVGISIIVYGAFELLKLKTKII